MKEKTNKSPSMSSESSAAPTKPMRSLLRRVLKTVPGLPSCWANNNSIQSPQNRTTFQRDVEQEDLQCAGAHCLSSYYSVFVARLAMMVMLAILIGLLTLLTWHFTRVYTKKSLDTLAYGLRYELLQRPILRMWNIFNTTIEITTAHVKMSEFVMKKYSNPVDQAQQVEAFDSQLYQVMRDMTWALFASHKALNSITINYRNGFVQAFHRDHKSNNTFYIYSDLVNYSISGSYNMNMLSSRQGWNDQSVHNNISAIWYREPLDPVTGEKIGKSRAILPDDLIYIAGISQVPDGAASWHVAVSKYSESPLLSAALPVLDSSKECIVAVVGVTTALYSVGQLMKELVEFHTGHIYLTSQEGWLLATSTNTPLLMNTTTGPKLMMAADSEDHVIRSGADLLQKTDGNSTSTNHEVHIENVRLGHQLYYIDTFFLNLKRLPMVGVIIIPRKYIMGKVDERAIKTLIILISASLCILVIGCVCIFILTNGVSKEMKLRAELISHLDARRKAEASSNYKSQFLANMSHELRTPMAAVIGLLDILMCDDCLTSEQYSTITQIRRCSTALLRLLNNILDLSKVESGKLVLEVAEFDLGRELEGLVDMFSVQCINHNVETVLDLSDDMPRLVQGDSGRVVQIFANLISNSIKFTTTGYIVLRGWCENPNTLSSTRKCSLNQKDPRFTPAPKFKLPRSHDKRFCRKDNKMILYFEVEDTGCGIEPRKWDSVFESFEQADPSTTRLHGGTGLGLCIVRTLVNQMGGEIRVIKKDGPGTLMQLYLLLSAPVDETRGYNSLPFAQHNLTILLALGGKMGRLTMSRWLQRYGMHTYEASEWNELTQTLQELFQGGTYVKNSPSRFSGAEESNTQDKRISIFIIIIDIRLLDLSTDIWKEQLIYLDKYSGRAKFAWILNHDTSNNIKMELRRKGHLLMVNRPLYKAKMIQIMESAIRECDLEMQKDMNSLRHVVGDEMRECLEMNQIHSDNSSSSESDNTDSRNLSLSGLQLGENQQRHASNPCLSRYEAVNNCYVELTEVHAEETELRRNEQNVSRTCSDNPSGGMYSTRSTDEHKSLQGVRILLAEDTPLLQKVATIMLERLGATVVVVGDGLQAVNALKIVPSPDEYLKASPKADEINDNQAKGFDHSTYDLILMDCQMPKMDGYEATKAIRRSELGTSSHIPIVALTAHAMSSDEAKCLEVGMDAYLTKPIDRKLMVSTILSMIRRNA
ncbi:Proteasome A-type subunit [Heracleum sosnowskyi]|uniref:histidine kinase n=1 Tax=Heracleum sosnowskyi TaxID=360622 RepID=A0AAD8MWP6_9APIA|nr:Proteasome A-type subunit [Heracleum sosnowskyi]